MVRGQQVPPKGDTPREACPAFVQTALSRSCSYKLQNDIAVGSAFGRIVTSRP